MSSIGKIISVASGALRATQAAMGATAHNVANAGTEGYSRQRVILQPGVPVHTPQGSLGTGVRIMSTERVRDSYLDTAFRNETSLGHGFAARAELLRRMEGVLGEPGDVGVAAALDAFYSSWSGLATTPESAAARSHVIQSAETLIGRIRTVAVEADRLRSEGEERLLQGVARLNALLDEIGATNRLVITAEASGNEAPDLRDRRDRAIDELASLVPLQVMEEPNGSLRVTIQGVAAVDGMHVTGAALQEVGGELRLQVGGRTVPLAGNEGTLGGLFQVVNEDLPALRLGMDRLAQALVDEVNAIHRTGTTPAGAEGENFFHVPVDGGGNPLPVSATTLRLADAILASSDAVAAGRGSEPGDPLLNEYLPGRNEIALALANLRDVPAASLDRSLSGHYREVVSRLAASTRESLDGAEVHGELAELAEIRRSAVSGVSLDEELARMIQLQAAYSAAARVVQTADRMLETLTRL